MPVPLLDIGRQHAGIMEELRTVLEGALASSRFIKGPVLDGFEESLAAYCGTGRAVGCASGTDALILALQAAGTEPGDTVVTVPFTFFASAGAVVRAGGVPAFVDVLPGTLCMDPSALDEWLETKCDPTPDGPVVKASRSRVRAVIPVDLFGQVADMDSIGRTCAKWGIALVEDACQAIGGRWMGRRAGSFSLCGCFSFFPSKNLGALGDAGAITTDDSDLADRLVRLREHGGQGYFHSEVGTNSRMDALQAGFLTVKLRHLDSWHEGRRRNAAFYDRALAEVDEVSVPVTDPAAWSVYNQYTIRARRRDGLMEHLKSRGIGCAIYYPLPLHLQECFRHLGFREGDFPVSEEAAGEVLSLPVFGELEESELLQVVDAVKEFYALRSTGRSAG